MIIYVIIHKYQRKKMIAKLYSSQVKLTIKVLYQ